MELVDFDFFVLELIHDSALIINILANNGDDGTEIQILHERPSFLKPVNLRSIGAQCVFDILLIK